MGKKPGTPRRSLPSFQRHVYVRALRGSLVAQRWPKPRPSPRHPLSEFWTDWLRQADLAWQALPTRWRNAAIQAARGQPQMPRDLALASMRGTLWAYTTTEGFTRWPMAALSKISQSLDVISTIKGALLTRGATLWHAVPAATADQVLTWNATTEAWEPRNPAAGGAGYTPPSIFDFTRPENILGGVRTQAPTGPAVFYRPAPNTTNQLSGFTKNLPAAPKTYILAMHVFGTTAVDAGPAMLIGDSAANRWIAFTISKSTAAGIVEVLVEYWTSLTAFSSEAASRTGFLVGAPFLQFIDDGTNFTFKYSTDAEGWIQIFTASRTAFLAAPDRVGWGYRNRGNEVAESASSFFHYSEA